MAEYKDFLKKRNIKQLFMASVFLFILFGGWWYPLLGYFIPLCMFLGIGIGFWKGRKWCDWLCPRGSFTDVMLKPVSLKRKTPRFLKGLPFRISFLSFLMAMMTLQIIRYWPDPYKIGLFFVILLTVTTIVGVILAIIYHQRAWCCFCPIGSMANWVGKTKYLLKISSEQCTECKLCYKVCPIQIEPYLYKTEGIQMVNEGDCLKCQLCVTVCPTKALCLGGTKI